MVFLNKKSWCLASVLFVGSVSGHSLSNNESATHNQLAPGAPGQAPVWAFAGKVGIGTSYEAYRDGRHSDQSITGPRSQVWFSLAKGHLTETMFGLIHEAQLKDWQLAVVGQDQQGNRYVDWEATDMTSEVRYLHQDAQGRPLSLAYDVINRDRQGRYEIRKHVFTDPDRQSLFIRTQITALKGTIQVFASGNPHVNNDGYGDKAWVSGDYLMAEDQGKFLSLYSGQAPRKVSVGFVGVSDGATDLADGRLDWQFATTGDQRGNVAWLSDWGKVSAHQTVQIDTVLSFADSAVKAQQTAKATFVKGYDTTLAQYNGEGKAVGWEDYLASLSALSAMADQATDGGRLAYVSAMVLKAQEDKTHSGALIASLSNPWGDTASAKDSATGYKAVWPRDFYQCAMALLALGDIQTPKTAFEYLKQIQVTDKTPGNKGAGGWFLQKTHVDGTLEWSSVQLDQTAMPIMLGWKLWQAGVLSDAEAIHWYNTLLRPAANFLVKGGQLALDWNTDKIIPPFTQQERWEEQGGYSPSTLAATVTGLVSAAELATLAGDANNAARYLQAADDYGQSIERLTFTTQGHHGHNGRYYLRINGNQDPNDNSPLLDRNGKGALGEKDILDAGFLELVRYGLRSPQDKYVLDSLEELDDTRLPHDLRVKYDFTFGGTHQTFPGWRRYGHDGYGEDHQSGKNYGADGQMRSTQRGRVWPFFTGERGHYELSKATTKTQRQQVRNIYVRAMEQFANSGLMLPEQVWDGVGQNSAHHYQAGEGTNAATPLAWTHAEYLKLLKSLADQRVWDFYPPVAQRYLASLKTASNP